MKKLAITLTIATAALLAGWSWDGIAQGAPHPDPPVPGADTTIVSNYTYTTSGNGWTETCYVPAHRKRHCQITIRWMP